MRYNNQKYDNAEFERSLIFFKKHVKGSKLVKQRKLYPLIPDYELVSNKVSTSKYTIITFLPKMLIYQFSKLANVYFLIIGLMQCAPQISISDGKPVMFLPFTVILFISAIKEIFEDKKRKDQDNLENSHLVIQSEGQNLKQVHSQDLHPGHVIKITKNEQIPADVVLLKSSEENGICNIETMNLDGETNLKLRIVPKEVQSLSFDQISNVEVKYEAPNRYLYQFQGQMNYQGKFNIPLNGINILLRGSSLKNTEYVFGLVIYSGHESKIMMNSSEPAPKLSSLEKMMNKLIIILFTLQILICFFTSAINYIFMKNMQTSGEMSYLETEDHAEENSIAQVLISMGTWMLIFTNFIPISLLVTLEIVKFYQGYNLMNEEGSIHISVQSSSLNEELGQINHIFSDKTGTLTLNRMEFKNICIDGVNYGQNTEHPISIYKRDSVPELNSMSRDKVEFVDFDDPSFFNLIESNNKKVIDTLLCISLCHDVVVEKNNNSRQDNATYSASSPDELALISFAKLCGFIFQGSKKDNGRDYYSIKYNNNIIDYEILQFFEFNSFRKRVSIIVKNPKGQIELFCKGADSVIEQYLSEHEYHNEKLNASRQVTVKYANIGLRTLFLAKKDISQEEYNQWCQKYNQAGLELVDREIKIEKLRQEIEKDLEFLGVTAVEDKLQDEVGSTIQQIREAGIKFWVLTGDKKETAINISHSAQIIESDSQLLDLDLKTIEQISQSIKLYISQVQDNQHIKYSLVISGDSFHIIENDNKVSQLFVELSLSIQSVIGCRFSPSQKKHAVSLIKKYTKKKPTLAIGDGANDVNMILEAHVGIGVKGVEGSQASRASDFSVSEFKYLRELLFDYGRECYRKNSELVLFNFYKNLLLVLPQWWYGAFYSLLSGTTLYEPWIYQMFNTFYTAVPIVIFALIDREYSKRTLLLNCHFYKQGIKSELFNTNKFIKTFLNGVFQALIIMVFTFLSLENTIFEGEGQVCSFQITGMVSFTVITLYTNLKVITFSNTFSLLSMIGIIGSFVFYILTYYIMTESDFSINNPLYKTFGVVFGNSRVYYIVISTCTLLYLMDTAYQRFTHFTYDSFIIAFSKIKNRIGYEPFTGQDIKIELGNDIPQKNNNYQKLFNQKDY